MTFSRYSSPAPHSCHRIGIDLGGTKIEGIVLDAQGHESFRKRIPTEQEKGYSGILANIESLYREMADSIRQAPHTFGIGTPGALSIRTGLLKNSNTLCLNGQPLRTDLEERLKHSVTIQNDANCFAMAEALHGAGRDQPMVFGVIMGTGCGGGLVYRGEVITGRQAIAGEWGHMSIDPNGPPCYCGSRGCVETFISGGGLERQWKARFGKAQALREIVAAFRSGDSTAIDFMQEFFSRFGRAMANLINILDPDMIVLGGGVSNIDELYTDGIKAVANAIFSDSLETPIVRHALGDSAGVIGAALVGT
ncbi:MAG: N-acetylglucosamine kinase [Lentisphaerae bacterium RIFOXYC12_FULL_60_16]|nr:MAG: N-acetylglucosamine kinase [Lentisphaerae bacterium RIFOXYC12_FULL_60_16]